MSRFQSVPDSAARFREKRGVVQGKSAPHRQKGRRKTPFIPRAGRTPGFRVSRDVLAWILGLCSAKLERCRGWFELRELDDMATGMALRAIDDAICHGGLLKKAIIQMQLNFENAGRKANKIWMGRLHTIVRATWPRFRVLTLPNLQLSGVPDREPGVKLSKHFSCSAWLVNWKKRQLSLSHLPS